MNKLNKNSSNKLVKAGIKMKRYVVIGDRKQNLLNNTAHRNSTKGAVCCWPSSLEQQLWGEKKEKSYFLNVLAM